MEDKMYLVSGMHDIYEIPKELEPFFLEADDDMDYIESLAREVKSDQNYKTVETPIVLSGRVFFVSI